MPGYDPTFTQDAYLHPVADRWMRRPCAEGDDMRQDDVTALRKLTAEMLAKYADSEAVVRAAREPLYAALTASKTRWPRHKSRR